MDYRRYSFYNQSLVCYDCETDLIELYGKTSVNTLLYIIREHDREAHDS